MSCLLCDTRLEVVNIGESPIAGYVVDTLQQSLIQPKFPLNMQFCPNCNFTRYEEFSEANNLLCKLYQEQQATYSLTKKNLDYLRNFVQKVAKKYSLNHLSKILEIGCNDGTLLHEFRKTTGCTIWGFEPSKSFAEIWQEKEISVINDFFNQSTVEQIAHESFDIVIIRHVLEHISDLDGIMTSLDRILSEKSALIIEVPYLPTILEKRRIDNISYPHINYFSTRSLAQLLAKYNLGIEHTEKVDTDGGSMLVFGRKEQKTNEALLDTVSLKDLRDLAKYIEVKKSLVEKELQKYSVSEIIGYGAGPKGQHLIHIFGLERFFQVALNDIEFYQGKYIPGTSICIEKPSKFISETKLKAIINLAPTHSEAIRGKVPQHLKFIELIDS